MARKSAYYSGLVTSAIVCVAVLFADHVVQRQAGLQGRYFSGPSWSGTPFATAVDRTVDTDIIREHVPQPDRAFSVVWTGRFLASRPGTYTFATISDDGSLVEIDGRTVVDNGGMHAAREQRGDVWLAQGGHRLLIRYSQSTGFFRLQVLSAFEHGPLEPVSWEQLSSRPSAIPIRFLHPVHLAAVAILITFILIGGLALVDGARRLLVRWGALEDPWWIVPTLAAAICFGVGLTWGLPCYDCWAVDEIGPLDVIDTLRLGFVSGPLNRYPPLHYYLLELLGLPFIVADRLRLIELHSLTTSAVLFALSRTLIVGMGLGCVLLVYQCGRILFGTRAGMWAAVIVATTVTFVYYSKVANLDVPYVFWFLGSFVFYVRVWIGAREFDYYLFAALASLAVCTKDQAYALYILPGFAVAVQVLGQGARGATRDWRRGTRVIVTMAGAALVIFALVHNLVFNWQGFVDHVRLAHTLGLAYGGMFSGTVRGQMEMLLASCREIAWSLGWPMVAISVAGIAYECFAGNGRRVLWLVLPVISYYVFFIGVVRYEYDRFFLPVCAVLALFGGRAIAWLLSVRSDVRPWRDWARRGVVTAAVGWAVLRSVSFDALMVADSRYDAERWLRATVPVDAVVGSYGPSVYLPRLQGFNVVPIGRASDLTLKRPDYVVINAEYCGRFTEPSENRTLCIGLESGAAGYDLAYRYKARPWWNVLTYSERFSNDVQDGTTNLDKVDPLIEIYRRRSR